MITHFPIAANKNLDESPYIFFVNDILVTVYGNASLRMDWKRPWGAISITIASLGMSLRRSSKNTQLNKLFVWYSGDEYLANSEFHFDSGKELLNHFNDLNFGSLII